MTADETADAEARAEARAAALRAKLAQIIPPRPLRAVPAGAHASANANTSANIVTNIVTARDCPLCGGSGWVRAAPIEVMPGAQTPLRPCMGQPHEQERYERARRMSDYSDKLAALTFADYEPRDNPAGLAAARAWATDDGREAHPWLLLFGGYGTGKTHLLAAAFNTLLAAGRYPLYTLTPTLLDHIRNGLDSGQSQEYSTRFQAVQKAPILILDDLGAERRTEWTDETLFKLVDYRYRQELPTAVASNLGPDDLEQRIASRLQDVALARVVLMRGEDYRQRDRQRARKSAAQRQRPAKGAC